MNTPNSSQPLWDFALAFYAQAQVAETCLQLQDDYQANVCLLIGLRWLDARGGYLDEAEFARLKNHIEGWTREVVEPLRALRRKLKLPLDDFIQDEMQAQLRTSIKQAELLAEKKLLIEIENWAMKNFRSVSSKKKNNLELYADILNAPQDLIAIIQRG